MVVGAGEWERSELRRDGTVRGAEGGLQTPPFFDTTWCISVEVHLFFVGLFWQVAVWG